MASHLCLRPRARPPSQVQQQLDLHSALHPTKWSISPIIITESSGGSDGVFSRSNLLQWIEGPSSPARFFFLSVTIFYGWLWNKVTLSPPLHWGDTFLWLYFWFPRELFLCIVKLSLTSRGEMIMKVLMGFPLDLRLICQISIRKAFAISLLPYSSLTSILVMLPNSG